MGVGKEPDRAGGEGWGRGGEFQFISQVDGTKIYSLLALVPLNSWLFDYYELF